VDIHCGEWKYNRDLNHLVFIHNLEKE